jgi:integrase
MARTPGLWQRDGKGFWYTTLHGKQLKLSLDRKEAERALHELLADPPEPDTGFRPSIGKVCDLFLDHSLRDHEPDTYRWYKWFLQSFCDRVKKGRKVCDLKVYMVTDWIDANPQWAAVSCLLACLNWSVDQGRIKSHPLKTLKRGRTDRRERILTAEERQKIHEAVKDVSLRQFLTVLELTGARPFSELARTTARHVDLEAGTITFKKHKTVKKTRKPRVIYLADRAKQIVATLIVLYPEGPLFRNNRNGEAWNKDSIASRLQALGEKLKIDELTSYAWRHTYITEALERGLTADVVGELVGSSPLTIAKYYNSLNQKKDFLRDAAHRAIT